MDLNPGKYDPLVLSVRLQYAFLCLFVCYPFCPTAQEEIPLQEVKLYTRDLW